MQEADLGEARRIFRLAFGTFLGVPDSKAFWPGPIQGRRPWGSFGSFGPLTIRPNPWDRHIARKLLAPTMELFEKWDLRETGLFTFAHIPTHRALSEVRILAAIPGRDHVSSLLQFNGFDVRNPIGEGSEPGRHRPTVGWRLSGCIRNMPWR
jgi:hypothetical protein